jgi:acyl transferase domain-containing protein
VVIDYADAADLAAKATLAAHALADGRTTTWRALSARGVFHGSGPPPPVAFVYPGQGSQYADMLVALRAVEPLVDAALTAADDALEPVLGARLSALYRSDGDGGPSAAERFLRNTAVAHPAVLAADAALERLLAAYGIRPQLRAGHSLGEYAALAAAGALSPAATLEVVSAIPSVEALAAVAPIGEVAPSRLPLVAIDDNPTAVGDSSSRDDDTGRMAAVLAPVEQIEPILATVAGYVVVANVNSRHSAVIGGETPAVAAAAAALSDAGIECVPLPVHHAFHTRMVADAVPALRQALVRSRLRPPSDVVIANTTSQPYPSGDRALPRTLDLLAPQFATPISFVRSVETLWLLGARVFVEVGPKRAVHGFVEDVLAGRDAVVLFTNHPKVGDVAAFNQALCGLYALGLGDGRPGG